MGTVETWSCQHVSMLKALQGRTCLPVNPLRIACECHGAQHCDLVEDITFAELPSVLQENCSAALCSVQLLYCHPLWDTVIYPLLWPILAVMRIQLVNNGTFWGEGKSNVLILHSCSRICINMSWISRCWVLQLGILPFPTTFCFSSGFNLCGLENASRLWGLPKTNNN